MNRHPKTTWQHGLMTVSALALLSGCGTGDQKLVRAVPQEPPKIEAKIEPGSLPAIKQTIKQIDDQTDGGEAATGLPAIEVARKEALIASAPDGFVNATQYFPYENGALYELHSSPGFISTAARRWSIMLLAIPPDGSSAMSPPAIKPSCWSSRPAQA